VYASREERAEFVARRLGEWCGQALLRDHVGGRTYVGIDLVGKPDVVVDLEDGVLPFADCSFETVICTDVLEHVDSLHALFDELIRVCRSYAIISLPNPYGIFARAVLRRIVLREKGPKGTKMGLPIERPLDRHKWFYSYGEAERFVRARSQMLDCRVVELFPVYFRRRKVLEPARRLFYGAGTRYRDLAASALWAVVQRV
jgi:SAM-dependent methyltransferase